MGNEQMQTDQVSCIKANMMMTIDDGDDDDSDYDDDDSDDDDGDKLSRSTPT